MFSHPSDFNSDKIIDPVSFKEILDEINSNSITHVFLQAGVGGMAAAMIAGFAKLSKN